MTMIDFQVSEFVKKHVVERSKSFFYDDIQINHNTLSSAIEGKSILVIGGCGTIGSNYIKSLLQFKPGKIVVVDTNENGLTELVRDIRSTKGLFVPNIFITYPIDFGSAVFKKIYSAQGPFNIIANFAAHKHVRSEKDIFSIEGMIQNNLIHAHDLLCTISDLPPEHFFCVSTDKAANPVNVMGATKKLMEGLVIDFSSKFKCTTARFANVAFSNGSLLDGFLKRIALHQPLSVPKDVKRYFVSPEESGQICMLACILGNSGDIFFPKLQENQLTSFYEIADRFLHHIGLKMEECSTEDEAKEKAALYNKNSISYPVYTFSSNTSGEKLYEEFYTASEVLDMTRYHSLGVVVNKSQDNMVNGSSINHAISDFKNLFLMEEYSKSQILDILHQYIPTFDHIEKGLTLDSKM